MLVSILLALSIGVSAILIAANIFLSITTQFARRFQISPLIISVILVALMTTLPELTVTLMAIEKADSGLALGNALGSFVTNLLLVLGLAMTIGKVKIGTHKTQRTALILMSVTVLFVTLHFSSIQTRMAGWLLIFILMVTFSIQLAMGINGRKNEDKKYIKHVKFLNRRSKTTPLWLLILLSILSVLGLGIGGNITVNAISKLSVLLGISTSFLGMTLVSVSTSLPEMATILTAQKKKENKVVVGTILGSNIINITLFPGLVAIFTSTLEIGWFELFFVLLAAASITIVIYKFRGKILSHWLGWLFLLGYMGFLITSYAVQ